MMGKGFRISIFLAFIVATGAVRGGDLPVSFGQAKRILNEIYGTTLEPVTFYCGCEFSDNSIRPEECGYQARKQSSRGERLEWEHYPEDLPYLLVEGLLFPDTYQLAEESLGDELDASHGRR